MFNTLIVMLTFIYPQYYTSTLLITVLLEWFNNYKHTQMYPQTIHAQLVNLLCTFKFSDTAINIIYSRNNWLYLNGTKNSWSTLYITVFQTFLCICHIIHTTKLHNKTPNVYIFKFDLKCLITTYTQTSHAWSKIYVIFLL